MMLLLVAPAYGHWTASSTGTYARAQAATLATPGLTVGTLAPTTVPLSWTQPFSPTSYALVQTPGTLAGCSAAPATGSVGCTATGLTPNTAYTWTLSAFFHAWVSQASTSATTSRQATTTALSSLNPTTGILGTSFAATATVTGNSGFGTPAGSVVFGLYTSSSCAGAASYTSTRTLSGGTATGNAQPAVGTYYWKTTYTPSDSYNLASSSACSAAVTVTPAGGTFAAAGAPVTVTKNTKGGVPVFYPGGTAAGDLLLLVVVNNKNGDSKNVDPGWTLIDNPSGTKGADMQLEAYWRKAGTESSVTLDFKTNNSGASAWVLDYKNMATPALAGVSSGFQKTTVNSITPANLTTTAANTTVISLVGIDQDNPLSLQTPNSFTSRAALVASGGGDGRGLGVADRWVATPGSVSPPTWSQTGAASQWAYITVAFTSP